MANREEVDTKLPPIPRGTNGAAPRKPNEVPVPDQDPKTVPGQEPEPSVWPPKEPEITPGQEPLTKPPEAPPEIPAPGNAQPLSGHRNVSTGEIHPASYHHGSGPSVLSNN